MEPVLDHSEETVTKEILIKFIREAACSVFETMLGMDIQPQDAYYRTENPGPDVGLISLIGFGGKVSGTGTFACTSSVACKIADALFMTDHPSVEDEVLDAVAEVTNMILGNVKTELEDLVGPMYLSIPTVIYGKNFATRSLGKKEWLIHPFLVLNEQMEVRICMVSSANHEEPRPGFAKPYSIHV